MDSRVERRTDAIAPISSRTPVVRYINAGMTVTVAIGFIGEGLWLARNPSFAVGGAFAGATLAVGALGLILGCSWLFAILRDRD